MSRHANLGTPRYCQKRMCFSHFFLVVASYSNLSTYHFRAQRYEFYGNMIHNRQSINEKTTLITAKYLFLQKLNSKINHEKTVIDMPVANGVNLWKKPKQE